MLNETAKSLLTELADFLDTLPPERFDYGHWVGSDWKGESDLSCGTTACAAGWATTLPSFRERGLRLGPKHHMVATKDELGSAAIAQVLGIDVTDARYLFLPGTGLDPTDDRPSEYATASEVAAHIRRWVARQEETA